MSNLITNMQKINQKETIQDIAIKLVADKSDTKSSNFVNKPKESTIFITGSKGVGKSTIINQFLDRTEAPRPTLALEYSFGRRTSSGQGILKEICNVWELGTLENSNNLMEIPMRSHGLTNFTAIIVVDLSQPDRLWTDLEFVLKELKNSYQKCKIDEELLEKSRQRIGVDHPDARTLELFPFPIIIVGGKYDLFENQDPEIKKHVCRCLRSISHSIGAALVFFSIKHSNLVRILRDIFTFVGFGNPSNPFRKPNMDHNQPLAIPFGADTWERIGVLPTNSERIGSTYNSHIPQIEDDDGAESKTSISASYDPLVDAGFPEAIVDELRSQKDDELLRLIKDREMRHTFTNVIVRS